MIKEITINNKDVANNLLKVFDYKIDSDYFNNPFIKGLLYENIGIIIYTKIYQRIEIEYIVVNEQNRRSGIASKLLNYVVEHNKDIDNITLEVRESNTSAISFYQKNKFQKVTKRNSYYGNEDAILMMRKFDRNER